MSVLLDQPRLFSTLSDDGTDEFTSFANALRILKSDGVDPLDPDNGPAVVWKRVCESMLDHHSFELTLEQKDAWSLERNTWQLVQMLYSERTSPPQSSSSNLAPKPYLPPLNVVNVHLSSSKDLLELSTIRDWLHTCPASTHPAEIRRGYWPYTKAAIKHSLQKQPQTFIHPPRPSPKTSLVQALDPDAPLRPINLNNNIRSNALEKDNRATLIQAADSVSEKGRLEQLDEEYDRAMVKTLYEYVRAGEIGLALDFCRQCDHPWRAASLSGGRLFYDPVLSTLEGDGTIFPQDDTLDDAESMDTSQHEPRPLQPYGRMDRSGCLNRKLWKSMCLQMSSNKSLPTYEQALYGALAGEVNSVLPVCYTWEDHIWCHINSIFENQVDRILASSQMGYYWSHRSLPPLQDPEANQAEQGESQSSAVDEHRVNGSKSTNLTPNENPQPDIKLAMNKAFDKVLRSEHPALAESARNPFHVAQMWLAIDKINDLFTTFSDRLKAASEDFTKEHLSHLLRFFCHLILFLRSINEKVDSEASNDIIRAYVQVLEMENKHNLIAFYVAELQQESGVETYARYLLSLGPSADRQTRRTALLRASEHGLDLSRVACTAVKLTLQDITQASLEANQEHGLNRFTHQLTDKQKELIRSLEWLTIDPVTYLDALIQGNSLIRYFLTAGNPNAAREVVHSMPADLLTIVANEENPAGEQEDGNWAANTHNEILEFSQYRDFFNCLELHVQVNEVLSQRPIDGAPKAELQAFMQALKEMCDQLYTAVVEILCSEWLQDIKLNSGGMGSLEQQPTLSRRIAELNHIRNIYIPELVFRLHSALVDSGAYITTNLRRALELASLVADESFKNYVEFLPTRNSKSHKMKDYLRGVRMVALTVLKQSGTHPLRPTGKEKRIPNGVGSEDGMQR